MEKKRQKCATGRACYEQAEAVSTADMLNRSNARTPDRSNPSQLQPLACPDCQCWHVQVVPTASALWAPEDASAGELERRQRVVDALAKSNARPPRSRFRR